MNQNSTVDSPSQSPDADQVSRRAYEIWENEGRPDGNDLRHWLQAEQELQRGTQTSEPREANRSSIPPNTGTDTVPLRGTRAGTAVNREVKRSSSPPFGNGKGTPANGSSQ